MSYGNKHSRRLLLLGLVALCLLFFAAGWMAAEKVVMERIANAPSRLQEGMTKQQVDSVLRSRVLDSTEQVNGDLLVNYSIEYNGVCYQSGFSLYVLFDETRKVKSTGWPLAYKR